MRAGRVSGARGGGGLWSGPLALDAQQVPRPPCWRASSRLGRSYCVSDREVGAFGQVRHWRSTLCRLRLEGGRRDLVENQHGVARPLLGASHLGGPACIDPGEADAAKTDQS
jgi:hypothetical protein